VAPREKTSLSGVISAPCATSGERNAGVPVICPVWVSVTSPVACEMPKSVIFTRPSTFGPSPMSTLAGLTSRCTMPAAWVAISASATCAPIWATWSTRSTPSSASTSARLREGRYSMTSHGDPASSRATS
jgi:hypothetical protein